MGMFTLIYVSELDKLVLAQNFKNKGELKYFTVNIGSITR